VVREKLAQCDDEKKKLVYYCSADARLRTNAAALLGCYLILEHGMTADEAFRPLNFSGRSPFLKYRDASFEPSTFELEIIDVLRGIEKAVKVEILSVKAFDLQEYEYYDHPAVADLHVIVPGRFVAFKGPKAQRRQFQSHKVLTPGDYIDIFRRLQVGAVCRLNNKQYDESEFTAAGIRHYDMYFDDCTTPTEEVVRRFFAMCLKEKGAIAIHCKAGLGRTGTLIALWLMRKYHFTGKEAIGYIRVMRPGSILGQQQHFLLEHETQMWKAGDPDSEGAEAGLAHLRICNAFEAPEGQSLRQEAMRRAKENTEAMKRRDAAAYA